MIPINLNCAGPSALCAIFMQTWGGARSSLCPRLLWIRTFGPQNGPRHSRNLPSGCLILRRLSARLGFGLHILAKYRAFLENRGFRKNNYVFIQEISCPTLECSRYSATFFPPLRRWLIVGTRENCRHSLRGHAQI